MAAELVITDALVLDGTGAAGRHGDVLVDGDRIVEIAPMTSTSDTKMHACWLQTF